MPGIFCTSCGRVIPDAANRCLECGATVGEGDRGDSHNLAERVADALGSEYEVREEIGRGGYAMPFIKGESVGDRIRREGGLSRSVVVSIAQDVAGALDYAHESGVIHRDVKPDNILLEFDTGRSLLADFGIAKALEQDVGLSTSGIVVGTPSYMSPEQISGERDIDGRTDVYSLGVVVFEMLTGAPPFSGKRRWPRLSTIGTPKSGASPLRTRRPRAEGGRRGHRRATGCVAECIDYLNCGRRWSLSPESFACGRLMVKSRFAKMMLDGVTTCLLRVF
ncbi:MAG: serine/threonine-protein kinase [Gemmatimonadales bacterium]